MPQISHIKFKDIIEARRYDAEYFKPEYLKDDKNLDKFGFSFLSNISEVKGGKRLPLGESFSQDGIPYIRAEDIKNDFVQYENVPRISEELHKKLYNYQTKKGDVLLNIVGSVGGIGLVFFDIKKCNLTENASKITNLQKLNPETIFAYLLSKYGQNQIHREKVGTVQEKLALERIRRFKIPVFSKFFQDQIRNKIDLSYKKQQESKKLYKEAEELLLSELGLLDFKPQNALTFSTTKKEIEEAQRFDSEYFEPKYDDIIERIEKYSGGWDFVKNQFKIINGKTPLQYSEEEREIQILKTKQIRNEAIHYEGVAYSEKEFVKNILQEKDILFASMGTGSLGRTGIFYNFETNKKTSVDSTIKIFRKLKIIEPEVLQTFFNSIVGREYIYRYVVGSTGIISIKNDLVLNLKIPLIKPSIQKQIVERIEESHELRKESKELLEKAKKMVEEEIERTT